MVMDTSRCFFRTAIEGGKHWSWILSVGTVLRLTDLEGGANVGMLLYNPANLLERYNAPDTLKCQHTFKLTRGHCLYSDMGRIFCSITEDSVGWHDTVCGTTNREQIARRWGEKSYQNYRNDRTQNGLDAFLVEGGKYGLGKRDLAANLNWFSKAAAADDGTLQFDPKNARVGGYVDLRFEMDALVLLHTCPHPLNPAREYPRHTVQVQLSKSGAVPADDFCRNSQPENTRGYTNTEHYRQCAQHPMGEH